MSSARALSLSYATSLTLSLFVSLIFRNLLDLFKFQVDELIILNSYAVSFIFFIKKQGENKIKSMRYLLDLNIFTKLGKILLLDIQFYRAVDFLIIKGNL